MKILIKGFHDVLAKTSLDNCGNVRILPKYNRQRKVGPSKSRPGKSNQSETRGAKNIELCTLKTLQ